MPANLSTIKLTDSKDQTPRLIDGEIKLISGLGGKLFRLLSAVERSGSINQAAKEVGLTYKGAWEMLERANNLSPKLLVFTAVGGRSGGGTRLTPAGKSLLHLFTQIQREHEQFLDQLNQRLVENPEVVFLFNRMILKASARNQFFGKVTGIALGAVNVMVTVELKGGTIVVASITTESAQALAIKPGADVVVLINASQIIIVSELERYRLSACNQLPGTVSRIQIGAVNSEVALELAGGDTLTATVSNDSLETLTLAVGDPALAAFTANAVVLGVVA